jgi:hypothetical protein
MDQAIAATQYAAVIPRFGSLEGIRVIGIGIIVAQS